MNNTAHAANNHTQAEGAMEPTTVSIIDHLLSTPSPTRVTVDALKGIANSALFNAAAKAQQIGRAGLKHIGRGIDGYNDMRSMSDQAEFRRAALSFAGRDTSTWERDMTLSYQLYKALAARLVEHGEYSQPMQLHDVVRLMSSGDAPASIEDVSRIAEIAECSVEELIKRRQLHAQRRSQQVESLAPLVEGLLSDVADSGETEDAIIADMAVQQQWNLHRKALEASERAFEYATDRATQALSFRAAFLRKEAEATLRLAKAEMQAIAQLVEVFYVQHKDEVEL